jgi:pSer/pThr/pTyr-binding forkhead associated (FHA) protein
VQAAAAEPRQPTPPPPPNVGWTVILDGDREIPVTRLTLFGRNPQPRPGEDDAQLIKVVDEARTVSKTHLAINVDSRGVFVTDRGSTNGSAVTDPQGVYNLIAAEQPVRLGGEGYVVSFGNHHLRLVRR